MAHDIYMEMPSTTFVPSQEEILDDLQRCTLALGVSDGAVTSKVNDIRAIALKVIEFLNAFREVVPSHFDNHFRNPCWFSELSVPFHTQKSLCSSFQPNKSMSEELVSRMAGSLFREGRLSIDKRLSLYCLPSFFLAGFPKSGTTTLSMVLQSHSQIVPPQYKEIHWWTRVSGSKLTKDFLKLATIRYLFHFKDITHDMLCYPESQITFDASQSTLWDSVFFTKTVDFCALPFIISKILPLAKFIVVMRDPVSRLYSDFLYLFQRKYGKEIRGWPTEAQVNITGYFHEKVQLTISYFSNCLTRNISIFECLIDTRRNKRLGLVGKRIGIGVYYIHLLKWKQFYSEDSFLLLRTEDMKKDSGRFLSQITNFLGVSDVPESTTRKWFSIKYNVQKTVSTITLQLKMLSRTKEVLRDFYSPYNKKLAFLTNDDGFLWTS